MGSHQDRLPTCNNDVTTTSCVSLSHAAWVRSIRRLLDGRLAERQAILDTNLLDILMLWSDNSASNDRHCVIIVIE
eukprot:scaffold114942_cov39-Attheya_sp.AAC.1